MHLMLLTGPSAFPAFGLSGLAHRSPKSPRILLSRQREPEPHAVMVRNQTKTELTRARSPALTEVGNQAPSDV